MDIEAELRKTLIAEALKMLAAAREEPSLRAVARAAGVSAMAPYRHFSNKVDLLAAVADHGFELLRKVLTAADDRSDARDALLAQGMAYIDFATKNPALFRLMYSHQYGGGGRTDAVMGSYDVTARRVAEIVPTHAAAATLASRSLVQGMAMIVLGGRLMPGDDVQAALGLFVAGLHEKR